MSNWEKLKSTKNPFHQQFDNGNYKHMKAYAQSNMSEWVRQTKGEEYIDYKAMYHMDDMLNAAGMRHHIDKKVLRYGDAFPSILYAHGLYRPFDWKIQYMHWLNLTDWGFMLSDEPIHGDVYSQIDFIKANALRTPKKVLEIGSGSGHIALTLAQMGCEVQAIECLTEAPKFFELLNSYWFGTKKHNVNLINEPLHTVVNDIDWEGLDTIILCETLEHILEKDFNEFWEQVKEKFSGYFIVTNIHHPCDVGSGYVPQEHCRRIDDDVYDEMSKMYTTKFRVGAHIVIEI